MDKIFYKLKWEKLCIYISGSINKLNIKYYINNGKNNFFHYK